MSPFFAPNPRSFHLSYSSIITTTTTATTPAQNSATVSSAPQSQAEGLLDNILKTMSASTYTNCGTQTLPMWDYSVVWGTTSSGASTIATSIVESEKEMKRPLSMDVCASEKWNGLEKPVAQKMRRNGLRKGMKSVKRFGQATFEHFACGYLGVYGKWAVKY